MKIKMILVINLTLFLLLSHSTVLPNNTTQEMPFEGKKEVAAEIYGAGPELAYQPTSYDFGNKHEGLQDNATFEIWNGCGCGTLEYSLRESCEWIDVYPTFGTSDEEHDIITIHLDTTGLQLGNYTYDILIQSNDIDATFPVYLTIVERPNNPPEKPTIEGTTYGLIGGEYLFSATAVDPEEHKIYYNFSWGDGTFSGWLGPYTSGQTGMTEHSWDIKGTYPVKVKARDEKGKEGEWSDSLSVSMPKLCLRFTSMPFLEKLHALMETLHGFSPRLWDLALL